MIEADKMLHLRKYVLTVLRSDVKSRVARSLHSTSLSAREGGYVLRSLHHCYVPTSLRPNYTACSIRTLNTTVAQSSVDDVDQKLSSFCEDVKHGQLWSADRLREIIRLCDDSNNQLQPSIGVLLLKCCGNSLSSMNSNERQDLADRVWQLVKRNDGAVTLEHYNTLLNVHEENSSSVDPTEFLANMSVKPDNDTYRLLFKTAVKTGNTKHLQNIMPMIKAKNVVLDEDTFCILMQTHLTKGNINEALNVITFAQDSKLPVNKLYTKLACEYAAQGDIPNLVKILNEEPQSDVNLLKIIKTLSVSDNGRHIPVVLNFLMTSVSKVTSEINDLITELVRADRFTDVHTIIDCIALNKETAKHAKSFVNYFLTQLIMVNASVSDITRFTCGFVESGHEPMALTNVAEISLKLGRERLSLAIFRAMQKHGLEIRPHYYWPLLINAKRDEGEAKVFSLIASMTAMNVEFDFDTLISYVLPYVNTANPISTLQRLKLCGVPNNLLNTPMIRYLLQQNRLEDVLCLYQYSYMKLNYVMLMRSLISVYFATKDVESCVRVLTTFKDGHNYMSLFLSKLARNNYPKLDMEEFEPLLSTFEKHGARFVPFDAAYFKNLIDNTDVTAEMNVRLYKIINRMIDRSKESDISLLSIILHPKYMSTSQLACHLVELRSQGLGTRNVLRRLLEAYQIENNLRKVEEIKEEYDKNEYMWTPGMKIDLFTLYVRHGKLKEAEALLVDIRSTSPDFLIDSNKILLFATALVKAGKPKIAFDVIEGFKINNNKNMNRNCGKLLNALSESEYYENTKDLLHLLVQKGYCDVNTELLRPLIAIPLRQNNITSAVEMLTKCARLYKKLPLALEVFTALLRERDGTRLLDANKYIEQVYNMIATIKGSEAANTIVVIALANLNKLEELQSILQVTETCALIPVTTSP